jgi:cell division protein FtsZ
LEKNRGNIIMDESLFNPQIIEQMPNKVLPDNIAKITVIGVGGGGCNMINHMINEGIYKVNLIVANTDLQALKVSKAPKKIQLGLELTKGLGAGMKPEIGRDSAIESYDEIKEALKGSDIVFIAAGLGGGTGTGAAAIVAKAAKEIDALTVAVVTKPFKWEGKRRTGLANLGLEELKKVTDSIIVIKNDKLKEISDPNMGLKDAFKIVDNILYQAVNGMSEVILKPGSNDVNADFADISTIMQHKGMALMGIGKAKGEDAPMLALENAIKSPLLDEISLAGAKGIMVHWTANPNISINSITDIMEEIEGAIDGNADIIFGTTTDENLAKDEVKITIVATGFDRQNKIISKDDMYINLTPNLTPNNPEYYDTPPLMRGYSIKYQL